MCRANSPSQVSPMYLALAILTPFLIVTFFVVVAYVRERNDQPVPMWGKAVCALAIGAGEVVMWRALHKTDVLQKVVLLILYPIIAFIGLTLYLMKFCA